MYAIGMLLMRLCRTRGRLSTRGVTGGVALPLVDDTRAYCVDAHPSAPICKYKVMIWYLILY